MDIDIDIPSYVPINKIFPTVIKASQLKGKQLVPHPCGVYFENVPVDWVTGLSAIPYTSAEEHGFTKIDFLHLSFLNGIQSRTRVLELSKREPDWSLLTNPDVVVTLFQLKNSWEFVDVMKPKSIIELADVLAIIRPSKRHLLRRYVVDRITTRTLLYKDSESDHAAFRKSHAIAYAHVIVMQLNLITEAASATASGVIEL